MAQRVLVKRANWAGVMRSGHGREHLEPVRPGLAAQREPDVEAGQAVAGGDHSPDGEVGVLGFSAAWTRRRGQLQNPQPVNQFLPPLPRPDT